MVPEPRIEIGLALPQIDGAVRDSVATWEHTVATAAEAERLGFASVWLADHLFFSFEKYGAPAGEHFMVDPLVGLAGVAASTQRVRVGTLVLCAQLRPATWLAKNLSTLDRVAGGRLDVGVGAGWLEAEYVAAGVPFHSPGRRLQELEHVLATLKDEWGHPDLPGRIPRPVQQPHPPLWVGGKGDRLLDVAARHADGWNTVWSWEPDAYAERLRVLEAACERAGRDPATVRRSVGLYTLVGEDERDLRRRWERLVARTPPGVLDGVTLDEWRRGHLVGTPEQVREQVARWVDLGVASLIVSFGALPFGVTDADALALVSSALIQESGP